MQYEGECFKNIEWLELYGNCIKTKNKFTYQAVPNDVRLYRQTNNTYDL